MACDLAIVGGGIVGVAHAVAAVRRGLSVELVDRSLDPRGASVRNFGMIWPIGQPRGLRRALALESAGIWRELAVDAGFRCERVGSIHSAHHDDEWKTLQEYASAATPDEGLELWSPEECAARAPGTVPDGLRGALFSPHEASVDPPHALAALHAWSDVQGVRIHAPDAAVEVSPGRIRTAAGRVIEAARIAVCSGSDFESLFPGLFAAGWVRCRLQMMATVPQPTAYALGPMRAAGLTLLHYPSFADCPSLPRVRARLELELPEHRAWGIHVMAAHHGSGEVVLGDSHEYGRDPGPGLRADVEELILRYLARFLRLPRPAIGRRWSGVYAVRDGGPHDEFAFDLATGVTVVNGVAGAGMTLSFGIADRHLDRWFP